MGVIALGKDEGDPAQDQRPAEGCGELQVGQESRRTQFREADSEGLFQSPLRFPGRHRGRRTSRRERRQGR